MTPAQPDAPRPGPDPLGTPRVAFVGIGTMATSVLAGTLAAGLPADRVCVSARTPARVEAVAERFGVRGTTSNPDAVTDAHVVVVAVPPKSVPGVLDEIAAHLLPNAAVVSFAGGVTLADLADHLRPGQPLVRAMPNVNAGVGQGVTGVSFADSTPARVRKVCVAFLHLVGHVVEVPEHLQSAVGALAGSGPAHVFYLLDAMAEAGVQLGLARDLSLDLARRTLAGSAALALRSEEHPAVLRERVCSPGGSTITAIGELDDHGVRGAITAAISGRNRT